MNLNNKKRLISAQTVIRKPPVNLIELDEFLFQHEYQKRIEGSYYLELKSVLLFSDTLFSIIKLNFCPSETHINGYFSKKDKIRYIKQIRFPYLSLERGVWITQNWTSMYFHWITDALTRYIAVVDKIENAPVLVPKTYQNFPYIREILFFLNIPHIWYDTTKTSYVSKLYLPSHTSEPGNYNEFFLNKLRALFLSKIDQKTPERKIYISRNRAKSRRVTNEEKLKTIFAKYDIEIHCLENYSFVDQIKLINQSTLLIGPHGAGLTNMLFLQKNAKLLEVRLQNDKSNNCFFSLASALNIPYYYIIAQISDLETNDMILNLEELDKLLAKLI